MSRGVIMVLSDHLSIQTEIRPTEEGVPLEF